MDRVFRLPDLGEGLHDAEIIAWHVGVGDHVVGDQPLLAVETDKAVVEIPSPRAGRIAALHGAPGDTVAVGAALVEFDDGPAADTGAIVGDLPQAVRAAPVVRRQAAERGIDLATIAGTGPDGAVTLADVDAAAAARAAGTTAASAGERLRGVRRAMHRRMTRAAREVVRATVTGEADIDAWAEGTDVTLRLVRAVVRACEASPSLNAWFDGGAETRTLHRQVDLGIALESDDGLFVPVLRDAGRHDTPALRARIEDLKRRVAARTLPHADLVGPTITLSNFGMHGGRFAELVVMPPQVAILGAGRAQPRVLAVHGAPAVRRVLPLSLAFDHRAVTGVEAARFLTAAIDDLQRP